MIFRGEDRASRLWLWSLAAVLAVGSLAGCSRASTKSNPRGDGSPSARATAEVQENIPGPNAAKPSPCIKFAKSGRYSKPVRRVVKSAVNVQRAQQERKLQVEN